MVSVMRRVAAISAGPRSASPRGRRGRSFWGFFGFSAMGGVGTSRGSTRQPSLLLPLPLFAGEGWGGGDAGPGACGFPPPRPSPARGRGSSEGAPRRLRRRGLALRLHFGGVVRHQLLRDRAGGELPLGDLRQ